MKVTYTLMTIATLIVIPTVEAATGIVAAWDQVEKTPDYLTGKEAYDQSLTAGGETWGTVFDVQVTTVNDPKKQATRQSTDGTYGDGVDLVTLEGNPISPDTVNPSGLRLNNEQAILFTFTNKSGGTYQLERFYFDWTRANDTAPQTITFSYTGPDMVEEILLNDSTAPVTLSIDDFADYSVDLSAYAIANGEVFTLKLEARNGETGSIVDNIALSVTGTAIASTCAFEVADGWVNTDGWMGWISGVEGPWHYSLLLDGWIYLEVMPDACSDGSWVYIGK